VRTAAALTAAALLTIARCLPRDGERRNHAGDGPALRDPGGDFGSGVLVRQYLKLPRSTSWSPSTARGGERHARDQEGGSTPNNIMNLGKILRV